jgi:hypothetical protein
MPFAETLNTSRSSWQDDSHFVTAKSDSLKATALDEWELKSGEELMLLRAALHSVSV